MPIKIRRWFLIFNAVCLVFFIFINAVRASVIPMDSMKVRLSNVDVRRDSETQEINSFALVSHKAGARVRDIGPGIEVLRSKMLGLPDGLHVDVHPIGLAKSVINYDGFLTRPQAGNADQIARRFLHRNKGLFGLSNREIRNLRISMNNLDETTGVTYMKYEQVIKGLTVFDSEISLTVTARGEVVIANAGQIIPGAKVNPEPALSIEKGIAAAFKHCGVTLNLDQIQGVEHESENGFAHFVNPLGEDREDILAMRVVVNVHGQAVVAYRVFVDAGSLEWYDTLVDANTGNLIYRFNIWLHAQGTVYTSSPGLNETNARTVEQFVPRFSVSSSDVWLLGTTSTGNNVDAYLDRDADDSPDADNTTGMLNGRAYAASGDFTFTFNVNGDPRNAKPAVVTNLFYFNNYMHDWMYSLGFTESARNFQLNNYGRGGLANDYVKAEAQDGSDVNNADFATPPDGVSGRMQQFLFTLNTDSTTDDRDSSVDGDVVLHEYGHGVSTRLIGNGSGLFGIQSGAMGEGWSDYWAFSNYNDGVMGEYVKNNSAGVRRAPYTVPANVIHDSYSDLGNEGFFEVHFDGEIWAAALCDLNQTLGKTVADKLILDGMKNTPTDPSMINARDGILAADSAVYFNVHKCDIWTVFARHGMGCGASGNDGTTHIASTSTPQECPKIVKIVNGLVTFDPIQSTYQTTSDTTGCPPGFVGKFSFDAKLINMGSSPPLSKLAVQVNHLTNGNLLHNADGGHGGEGSIMTIPLTDAYADGVLSAGEHINVHFIICLKENKSFRFLVDVLGVPDIKTVQLEAEDFTLIARGGVQVSSRLGFIDFTAFQGSETNPVLEYGDIDFDTQPGFVKQFSALTSSLTGGVFDVRLDTLDGLQIATLTVPPLVGAVEPVTSVIFPVCGVHNVFIGFSPPAQSLGNVMVDWFKFEQ